MNDEEVEAWLAWCRESGVDDLEDAFEMPDSPAAREMRGQVLAGTFDRERWREHARNVASKYGGGNPTDVPDLE